MLAAEAEATGFRAEMLEKSVRLLALLDALRDHPLIEGKLALKGGTALNLFVFNVPRLSVDIDLNYVGAASRDTMLEERPKIEAAIQAVFRREDFAVRRMPKEHAGGKWSLRYADVSGQSSRLDVDLNFMYRVPLWPVTTMNSPRLGVGAPPTFPWRTSMRSQPASSRRCCHAARQGTCSTAGQSSRWTPSTSASSASRSSSTER